MIYHGTYYILLSLRTYLPWGADGDHIISLDISLTYALHMQFPAFPAVGHCIPFLQTHILVDACCFLHDSFSPAKPTSYQWMISCVFWIRLKALKWIKNSAYFMYSHFLLTDWFEILSLACIFWRDGVSKKCNVAKLIDLVDDLVKKKKKWMNEILPCQSVLILKKGTAGC